jgi:hypothetical protein
MISQWGSDIAVKVKQPEVNGIVGMAEQTMSARSYGLLVWVAPTPPGTEHRYGAHI